MTPIQRLGILAFTLGLCANLPACAADRETEPDQLSALLSADDSSRFEAGITALMDSGAVAGLSVAITSDSAIVWSKGFGLRNRQTGESVDTNTVFEAASLSKPVFAYAFLQLVDEGLFDLDAPIADYYRYESIAHDESGTQITPRHVLTHSTGFPNWRPRGGQLTINFEPGTEFSYSGEGFVYLQRAVTDMTGEPLDQLARRLVFDPLGMTSSSYVWQDEFEETIAMPHGEAGEVLRKNKPQRGGGNAAASLHTTANDYARFIMAVMNGTGLTDSTAAAMLTPQIGVDSSVSWGLGIGLQDTDYGRGFWHWGDNSGYKAYTLTYPERHVGVIWFTNSESGHSILDGMLDLLVGGEQPGAQWLAYEQFDSPLRKVRTELEQVYAEQGLDSAIARYHVFKTSMQEDVFDEFFLNSMGYRLLGAGYVQDAIAVFELNVAEYPDASNPYDSLGEAYLAAGDTSRAIVNYQRAVELDPSNTNGAALLQRLRASSN